MTRTQPVEDSLIEHGLAPNPLPALSDEDQWLANMLAPMVITMRCRVNLLMWAIRHDAKDDLDRVWSLQSKLDGLCMPRAPGKWRLRLRRFIRARPAVVAF